MARFRRKPLEVEAIRVSDVFFGTQRPQWVEERLASGKLHVKSVGGRPESIEIFTLDGMQRAPASYWLVHDSFGHVYALSAARFEALYEATDE